VRRACECGATVRIALSPVVSSAIGKLAELLLPRQFWWRKAFFPESFEPGLKADICGCVMTTGAQGAAAQGALLVKILGR